MKTDRLALSTDSSAQSAALSALGTGNAVDALVAGVLAAAATHPSVLFGPMQALVGGSGLGLHAVDGRMRQPGIGAPRPRGFLDEGTIPLAARVAIPMMPHALSSLAATFGTRTFNSQATAAKNASDKGSPREKLFAALASRGPAALVERGVFGEIELIAGRMEGGLVTREDFEALLPTVQALTARGRGAQLVSTPWADVADGDAEMYSARDSRIHVLLTADRNGGFAACAFEVAASGVEIAELGIVAPLGAAPVMRGKTRAKPGDAIPSLAPIRLFGDASIDGAFGASHPALLERLEELAREPVTPGESGSGGDGPVGLVLRRQEGRVGGRAVRL